MRKVTQAVSLFYSSTEDLADRQKELVEKVARRVGHARDVVIHVIHWRSGIPGGVADGSGQDRIDAEIEGTYDIYFGCMGVKFGKGTVQEFERAIKAHIDRGDPAEVLFGFDTTSINPFEVPDNFSEVRAFRASLQSSAKFGKAILYFEFSDHDQLDERLSFHLDGAVRKAIGRISGGPPAFR